MNARHRQRLAENPGDAAAYIKAQRAVVSPEGHAYWVEGPNLWGLSAGRGPGWETCGFAGPAVLALWAELDAHRSALAEAEAALRAWGDHGVGGLHVTWKDRDKLTALADRLASVRVADVREVEKERDAALAEAARLRAVLDEIAADACLALAPST